MENTVWINQLLTKLWPKISDYINTVGKEKLPENLEFDSLSLPQPNIVNVETLESNEESARVRVQVECKEDIVISLKVPYALDLLTAGVVIKEYKLDVLANLSPLTNVPPFFGAVQVTLLDQPHIKYDLSGVGNVGDIPGIKQIVYSTLMSIIDELVVAPNHFLQVLQPLSNEDLKRVQSPLPIGVLDICLWKACGLPDEDTFGKTDCFAVMKLGSQKFKSKTVDNSLNPVWNSNTKFLVTSKHQILKVQLLDHDVVDSDDFLGEITVTMDEILKNESDHIEKDLKKASSGKLFIKPKITLFNNEIFGDKQNLYLKIWFTLQSSFLADYDKVNMKIVVHSSFGKYESKPNVFSEKSPNLAVDMYAKIDEELFISLVSVVDDSQIDYKTPCEDILNFSTVQFADNLAFDCETFAYPLFKP